MDTWIYIVLGFVFTGIGVYIGKKLQERQDGPPPEPPDDPAVKAGRDAIDEVFEESVTDIKEAGNSDDPEGDLADLGNARRRRP
jgi:hypothetical protein